MNLRLISGTRRECSKLSNKTGLKTDEALEQTFSRYICTQMACQRTGTQEPEHLENENQGYWVSTLYPTGHWASNSNENRLENGCLQGCELLNGTAIAKQRKQSDKDSKEKKNFS